MEKFKLDNTIKVCIVDKDIRWSQAVKMLIEDNLSLRVIDLHKEFPKEKVFLETQPHLVLVNVDENSDSYKLIKSIKVKLPFIQFLPYSDSPTEETILNFIEHDSGGFLINVKFDYKQLIKGIVKLQEGKPALSPIASRVLVSSFYNQIPKNLTKKEIEVLNQLKKGKNSAEIAKSLDIKQNTVRAHMYNIYEKLDVKNKAEAIALLG
ncbi:response regulator transcription factor [Fulvivirga lutea]|uniref:Response regulator transcription factor n=1 Tax=Fulvivirga lutea TaxID=2810512 RepID=A0A974WI14_9BACT|nr:response regulator transcription factor [Fulvivirga lutea]QSE97597.1 response regulator transcription factor [Fulvivirga lutea]